MQHFESFVETNHQQPQQSSDQGTTSNVDDRQEAPANADEQQDAESDEDFAGSQPDDEQYPNNINPVNNDNGNEPVNIDRRNRRFERHTMVASDEGLRLAPGENQIPFAFTYHQDSDNLSFIKIYMGEKLNPLPNVSYTSRCRSIARRYDRRAVMRPDYLLYIDRKIMLIKLGGNTRTILQKTTNNKTGRPYTATEVLDRNIRTLLDEDQAYKRYFKISDYVQNTGKRIGGICLR